MSSRPLTALAVISSLLMAGCAGEGASPATTALVPEVEEAGSCRPMVVLMGYWPPTNDMLRSWSQNSTQNSGPWRGSNWRGLGYDVVSFFPEFPPDGDPSNDQLGDPGAVGAPDSDLQVDYQDTSADFWRLVDQYQPHILITTSRGGDIGWEIEAVEGGHGDADSLSPADDWASDRFGTVTQPTQATVDPRSWQIMSTWRQGKQLPSQLPMAAIATATDALGLVEVAIDQAGTSGNFLSGFLGLHGLAYQHDHPQTLTAGHIHVGRTVPAATAETLMQTTLTAVLRAYPAVPGSCAQP